MIIGYVEDKFVPHDLVQISVNGLLGQIYSQQGLFTVKDMVIKKIWLYQMMFEHDREMLSKGHSSGTLDKPSSNDWDRYYVSDILRVEFDGRVNDIRIYFDLLYESTPNSAGRVGGLTYMDIPLTEPELICLIRDKKLQEVVGNE